MQISVLLRGIFGHHVLGLLAGAAFWWFGGWNVFDWGFVAAAEACGGSKVAGQKFFDSPIVLLKRVTRTQIQQGVDRQQQEELTDTKALFQPAEQGGDADGQQAVGMKLVVAIMDFNQPVVRVDSVFEFAKIPSRWPNTGPVMQRVNQQPPQRADELTGSN